jgi:hypothetical protein
LKFIFLFQFFIQLISGPTKNNFFFAKKKEVNMYLKSQKFSRHAFIAAAGPALLLEGCSRTLVNLLRTWSGLFSLLAVDGSHHPANHHGLSSTSPLRF